MPTLLSPHLSPQRPGTSAPVEASVPPLQDGPVSPRRRTRFVVIGVLGLFVALAIGLRLVHTDVLPGVQVVGQSVGGLDRGELRAFTEGLATTALTEPVTVAHDSHLGSLTPSDVAYEVDAEATAGAAWSVGRTGNPFTDTWDHLQALWGTQQVGVVDRLDDAALERWVTDTADVIDRQVGAGGLDIDPETLEVTAVAPRAGFTTDRPALQSAVRAALPDPVARKIDAPVGVNPVVVDPATVEDVAELARELLTGDVTMTSAEGSLTLSPAEVAPLLTVEANGTRAQLAVSSAALEEVVGDRASQLGNPPVDASFDLPREPEVQLDTKTDTTWEPVPVDVDVVPGTAGREFDAAVAAEAMGERFRAGQRDVTVELPEVEPELTTADLEAMNVTHLLGTFTTYYQAGQPRVTNIRNLADVLDGSIVAPGEQFSINRASGPRTCDKGYVRDGMILGGKLVAVCGGGVSQVGTAVFNAAFFSGVQIDQHKPHSWAISRYPMGREATLDFDSDIDVKFTNDTGNGMVLRTDHSSTHLTVSLYGTSDVEKVTAQHGAERNPRPAPVQYVEDPTLEPGTEKLVDAGHDGFNIDVTRITVREGGESERETWSHRYVTAPRIVHRNTAEPEPSPAPSPAAPGGEAPQEEPRDEPTEEPADGPGNGNAGGNSGNS